MLGGAKVATSSGCSRSLATKVDTLIVGGGMCFTFLAAPGHRVGDSLLDEDQIDDCRALLASGVRILLPTDTRALEPGATFGPPSEGVGPRGSAKVIEGDLPDGWMGLDIGPGSAAAFADAIARRPHGVLERADGRVRGPAVSPPAPGRWPQAVAESPGFTVVGGGDSASALEEFGLADQVDHVSTGGGASLELHRVGGDLPGLAALRHAPNAPKG